MKKSKALMGENQAIELTLEKLSDIAEAINIVKSENTTTDHLAYAKDKFDGATSALSSENSQLVGAAVWSQEYKLDMASKNVSKNFDKQEALDDVLMSGINDQLEKNTEHNEMLTHLLDKHQKVANMSFEDMQSNINSPEMIEFQNDMDTLLKSDLEVDPSFAMSSLEKANEEIEQYNAYVQDEPDVALEQRARFEEDEEYSF